MSDLLLLLVNLLLYVTAINFYGTACYNSVCMHVGPFEAQKRPGDDLRDEADKKRPRHGVRNCIYSSVAAVPLKCGILIPIVYACLIGRTDEKR